MAGSTCGEFRNAELTPGVRAWPREYYDPHAARQLGSRKAWPKCGPQDDYAIEVKLAWFKHMLEEHEAADRAAAFFVTGAGLKA